MSLFERVVGESSLQEVSMQPYHMGDIQMVRWVLTTLSIGGDDVKQSTPMYVLRRLATLAKSSPQFGKDEHRLTDKKGKKGKKS